MTHPLLLKSVSAKRLLSLFQQHGTQKAVARVLGVAACTVRDHMARTGVPSRPLARFRALSDDALLHLLAKCENKLRKVRRLVHVDWASLVAELEARDLRVEPKPLLSGVPDAVLVRALTENGMHLIDAARTLGVSRRVLTRVMSDRGLLLTGRRGLYPQLRTPNGLVRCRRHVAPKREHKLRALTTQALREVVATNSLRSASRSLRVCHTTLCRELERRGIPWCRKPGARRRTA